MEMIIINYEKNTTAQTLHYHTRTKVFRLGNLGSRASLF